MTKQKQEQDGMDFPHDLPRQNGKPAKQSRTTPPKMTKKDKKRYGK